MDYIKLLISIEPDKDNKILLLNYVLDTIKRDLKCEFQAAIIYEFEKLRTIDTPFPYFYYDENNVSQCIITNEYKNLDLSRDCIFALPWKIDSIVNTINKLAHTDFEFMDGNHRAYYYYPVDICYVYNGIHSISAGMHYKKGIIEARVCDVTPLFSNMRTDGANWYNIHTNEVKGSLFDFRTGLLFEVTKLKYKFEQECI